MSHRRLRAALAPAALLLLALAVGCGNEGPPGAGLTNGPPPGAGEKPAMRTDLPDAVPADRGELLGRTGDSQTNAGTAGRSPDGDNPDQPKPGKADDRVRARSPKVESSGPSSAAGGNKPAEPQEDAGSPRPPK
jgi:hypothetical protein